MFMVLFSNSELSGLQLKKKTELAAAEWAAALKETELAAALKETEWAAALKENPIFQSYSSLDKHKRG